MRNIAVLTAAALALTVGVAAASAEPVTPDLLPPEAFHNWTYQDYSVGAPAQMTLGRHGFVQQQGGAR